MVESLRSPRRLFSLMEALTVLSTLSPVEGVVELCELGGIGDEAEAELGAVSDGNRLPRPLGEKKLEILRIAPNEPEQNVVK